NFVSIPLTGLTAPSHEAVQHFLSILESHDSCPVYVHCEHGQDRTGTMIGIYRIAAQKWSSGDAYREMVERGFHPQYFWLSEAVFDYGEGSGATIANDRPFGVKLWDTVEQAAGLITFQKGRVHSIESPTAIN